MPAPPKWTPLIEANAVRRLTDGDLDGALRAMPPGTSREEARAALEEETRNCSYWINDLYQVQVRKLPPRDNWPDMVHLNIRRRDGKPIFRDWRHFQQIKNELVGEENEAVELYPAESRLNDTSNKYHLFALVDAEVRFPFGMTQRDVMDADPRETRPGYRQRKL